MRVAVGALTVWSGILTVAVLALLREVTIQRDRLLRLRGPFVDADFEFESDGLAVGSEVPESVLAHLPMLAESLRTHLLVASGTCMSCRELIPKLKSVSVLGRLVALVAGKPETADVLVEMLEHVGATIIRDPEASELSAAMSVRSAPFLMGVAEGRVRSKGYLFGVDDFVRLVSGDEAFREDDGGLTGAVVSAEESSGGDE